MRKAKNTRQRPNKTKRRKKMSEKNTMKPEEMTKLVEEAAASFFRPVEGQSAEVVLNALLFTMTTFFVKMNELKKGAGDECFKVVAREINGMRIKNYLELRKVGGRASEVEESKGSSSGEREEETSAEEVSKAE